MLRERHNKNSASVSGHSKQMNCRAMSESGQKRKGSQRAYSVRITPTSRHRRCALALPICANFRHSRQKDLKIQTFHSSGSIMSQSSYWHSVWLGQRDAARDLLPWSYYEEVQVGHCRPGVQSGKLHRCCFTGAIRIVGDCAGHWIIDNSIAVVVG